MRKAAVSVDTVADPATTYMITSWYLAAVLGGVPPIIFQQSEYKDIDEGVILGNVMVSSQVHHPRKCQDCKLGCDVPVPSSFLFSDTFVQRKALARC